MKFLNLTPHCINVVTASGEELFSIPASGSLARCIEQVEAAGSVEGVPLVRKSFGSVEGLPEPVDGVLYIVSGLVLSALAGSRSDVVAPGNPVRDDSGRIIGCAAFCVA